MKCTQKVRHKTFWGATSFVIYKDFETLSSKNPDNWIQILWLLNDYSMTFL